MQKVLEAEEPHAPTALSNLDEAVAEDFYNQTISQLSLGQYSVQYLFRPNPPVALGDSYNSSLSHLLCLEQSSARYPKFKYLYINS